MALPIALEIELDLLVRRAFEVADERSIEVSEEQGALLRYAFAAGVESATRDPGLLSRLKVLLADGGLQDPDPGV
jgi:hypothetical protein